MKPLTNHERRRKLNRIELVASQANTNLARIVEALTDNMLGHPPAHSYEGIPGTGAGRTAPVDADEHGEAERIPVTQVEENAIWQTDTAADDLAEIDRALVAAANAMERIVEIGREATREANAYEREQVAKPGDAGCQRCAKLGFWSPPFTAEATTVKGNLPTPMLLCEWEWRYVRNRNQLPTVIELRAHLEGRKVNVPA